MGEIVGAAFVSHVPTMVMPENGRMALNNGVDTSLVAGLYELGAAKLAPLEVDTVVVVDSHWITTIEHVVSSHDRRVGHFTSSELPRGMSGVPYDMPGDRELAEAWAEGSSNCDDTWVTAIDDPYLPVHYATTNLLPFLQRDESWVSASVCQTAQPDDFLLFGRLLAEAIAKVDRRVVILGSGGLSHRFWPLKQFRDHEAADPDEHIRSPEAAAADRKVIAMMLGGDHRGVLDYLPSYREFEPEALFAHYVTMVGALGGGDCTLTGQQFGEYESVAGTGAAHIWFDV
ncbi:hypothetical protein JYT71_00345 [Acidimicrobiaceae bacterium AH-315-P05]|nr:hypothetical protein [Acidimicrobiaceae bacterium AH-315-P05]